MLRGDGYVKVLDFGIAKLTGQFHWPDRAANVAGTNLATVEGRLLFLVGEEIVGSRNLGELGVRLGVVLVLVGVIGLGQPAVGRLQVLLAHRTRNPEHGVGIAHGFLLCSAALPADRKAVRARHLYWGRIENPYFPNLYGHDLTPCPDRPNDRKHPFRPHFRRQ